MPTYDYQCGSCGESFAVFHPMDAPPPPCPRCAAAAARRILLRAPAYHGAMAKGRQAAVESLARCGPGCRCCP